MATLRVEVRPELLRWARERARLAPEALAKAFPKLAEWERGKAQPTLKQLEQYARRTHAPIGYFFLPEPPDEPLPIPDFRTIRNQPIARPSADLLNTIYLCQQRQDWFRQYLRIDGAEPLAFVGSLKVGSNIGRAAEGIRSTLGFSVEGRAGLSFDETFRTFRRQAEDLGVLVMSSGIAGNATNRKLDPKEFRGFALVDRYAPVVFINTNDSTGAQIFTLAHELIHLWTGRTGLTDNGLAPADRDEEEQWCNAVAAELLVPATLLQQQYDPKRGLTDEIQRLALVFKVSSLVVLRRLFDAQYLSETRFWRAFRAELARVQALSAARRSTGGSFYNSELARVNRRVASAVISSALEGNTTYREAFHLLSIKNVHTLHEVGRRVGVVI